MLRLVPGVQVGQIDANKFQVSIRGFGGRYTNKLQVLVDGLSIYSPLFSGVFWESNMVSPSEIERIEVVRGPGGALWGPNALNGVINVITKTAEASQGGEISLGGGNTSTANHEARYGGKLGETGFFRVYARYLQFADLDLASGETSNDGWQTLHGGARFDWKDGDKNAFTLVGRFQQSEINELSSSPLLTAPYRVQRSNSKPGNSLSLTGSWTHQFDEADQSEARVSLSNFEGEAAPNFALKTSILDLTYQRAKTSQDDTRLIWGLSYRYYSDSTDGYQSVFLNPAKMTTNTFGAFGQIEKKVAPKVKATLGLTLEHNEFTGIEFQPSIRALWTPSKTESYWASVSRAVRTPNRGDSHFNVHYATMPSETLPYAVGVVGNEDFKSEKLIAFELGARFRPKSDLFVDLTAFFNIYDDLRAVSPGTPYMVMNPFPHIFVPAFLDNTMQGRTGGLEASASYRPNPSWRLDGSLTTFSDSLTQAGGGTLGTSSVIEGQGSTPRFQASLKSQHLLTPSLTFDLGMLHVGEISANAQAAYTRFDAQLTWLARQDLRISLSAKDLFGSARSESVSSLYEVPSVTQRSYSFSLSYRF